MAKTKFTRSTGAINESAKAEALIPFTVSVEKMFNVAALYEVGVKEYQDKNDENIHIPVLEFVFRDLEGIQTHIHKEWPIDGDLTSKGGETITQAELEDGQSNRIAHIFNTYAGAGGHTKVNGGAGLGADVTDGDDVYDFYKKFFASIANSFNTAGPNGTEIYKKNGKLIPIWIKLIYVRGSNELRFPLRPNFIDRWVEGRPTFLRATTKDVTAKASATGTVPGVRGGGSASSAGDDMPVGFNV